MGLENFESAGTLISLVIIYTVGPRSCLVMAEFPGQSGGATSASIFIISALLLMSAPIGAELSNAVYLKLDT